MNKKWWKAAGIRALKTICQTAVSMLTVGQAVLDVNWLNVLSVSAVAGVISLLTSIAGLPEVEDEYMDWSTVIVGVLSLLGTMAGSFGGMKLMSYRIEQLEKKVDKHNNFAERIPVIEEHIKNQDQRLDELEHKVG
jgi:hypothetical protein